jgi:hypothetical protein
MPIGQWAENLNEIIHHIKRRKPGVVTPSARPSEFGREATNCSPPTAEPRVMRISIHRQTRRTGSAEQLVECCSDKPPPPMPTERNIMHTDSGAANSRQPQRSADFCIVEKVGTLISPSKVEASPYCNWHHARLDKCRQHVAPNPAPTS